LGLDEVEQMFYGAAPMNLQTQLFYQQLNLPVISLYGLSETSAALTMQEFPSASLEN
jgi:long-subunit acyl-CoA synthetase (AMP-forming)